MAAALKGAHWDLPLCSIWNKKSPRIAGFFMADIRLFLSIHWRWFLARKCAVSLFTHAPAVGLALLVGSWFDRPVTGRAAHHRRQTAGATTLPLLPLPAAAAELDATRWVLVEAERMEKPPPRRCQ